MKKIIFDAQKINSFLVDQTCKMTVIEYWGTKNAAYHWWKLPKSSGIILRAFFGEILKKIPPCSLKNSCYRSLGMKIGKNVVISPNVTLDPFFPKLITIEDNAILGWGCTILTHEFLQKELRIGRVQIGKKTVIGADSLVRAGTTISDNAIIAAKSFANKDVSNGKMVGGVPIKEIKKYHS